MLHARTDDPSTSHDAMERISEKQMVILQHLHNNINSGATCNELSEKMSCPRDHITPNMPKLEAKGLVRRSGYSRDGQQVWLHMNYSHYFSPLAGDTIMEVKPKKPSRTELVGALECLMEMMGEIAAEGLNEKYIERCLYAHNLLKREKGE